MHIDIAHKQLLISQKEKKKLPNIVNLLKKECTTLIKGIRPESDGASDPAASLSVIQKTRQYVNLHCECAERIFQTLGNSARQMTLIRQRVSCKKRKGMKKK